MTSLLTADIHLTDNPRDEYRWGLIPWLVDQAFDTGAHQVLVLGDITDAKDKHSSFLVNRLTTSLQASPKELDWFFLKGNHDYIDENWPFFEFLDALPNVHFIKNPEEHNLKIGAERVPCLFLPSTKDWEREWKGYSWNDYDFIFTHQTFEGCLTENGTTLDGVPPSVFADFRGQVYSGDIHVPQKVARNVEYIGAPYHIRFGDSFYPRVLLVDSMGKRKPLRFPCQGKHLVEIREVEELQEYDEILSGDQVKVRVSLRRADYPRWSDIKADIREFAMEKGWVLFGPELKALDPIPEPDGPRVVQSANASPVQLLTTYASERQVETDVFKAGLEILNEASK